MYLRSSKHFEECSTFFRRSKWTSWFKRNVEIVNHYVWLMWQLKNSLTTMVLCPKYLDLWQRGGVENPILRLLVIRSRNMSYLGKKRTMGKQVLRYAWLQVGTNQHYFWACQLHDMKGIYWWWFGLTMSPCYSFCIVFTYWMEYRMGIITSICF